MSRRREINEVALRMAVASVGGTLSSLSFPPLENALKRAEGDGAPQSERADLVRMWDAWSRTVAVWSVVKQVADHALGAVSIGQEPDL